MRRVDGWIDDVARVSFLALAQPRQARPVLTTTSPVYLLQVRPHAHNLTAKDVSVDEVLACPHSVA